MQYTFYMITDRGATDKKMAMNGMNFHGNKKMKIQNTNIYFALCSYLLLGTTLNARQSHFTTKLASVHACLDFK